MPSYTSKITLHIPFFKSRHEEYRSCKSLLTTLFFHPFTTSIVVTIGYLTYQTSIHNNYQNITYLESNDATNNTSTTTSTISTTNTKVLSTSVSIKEKIINQQQQHLHAPIGTWRILRPNPLLEICYDTRTRNPIYVQYKLLVSDPSSNTNINNNSNEIDDTDHDRAINDSKGVTQQPQHQHQSLPLSKKHYNFYEDTSIEEMYRSRNSYYHNSGYDRGHLAPAADFAHITTPTTTTTTTSNSQPQPYQYLHDTYNLCNISPQHSNLNRLLWNQLEQLVRRMAKQYWYNENNAITYVTTGPIYLPNQQIDEKQFQYSIDGIGIPPCIIMVPTHFYKVIVILDSTETKILYFACFVLPNDPNIGTTTSSSNSTKSTLIDYVVPWSDLEAVTGLLFYPDLVDEQFKLYADMVTQNLVMKNQVSSSSSIRDNHHGTIQSGPLLITDGTESNVAIINNNNNKNNHPKNNKSFVKQLQQQHKYKHIQHLCVNDACIPRKQQQQQRRT
jgi:DNA/RNA endonuclease G (NUC1)